MVRFEELESCVFMDYLQMKMQEFWNEVNRLTKVIYVTRVNERMIIVKVNFWRVGECP